MFYGSFTAALPNLEYGAIPEITLEEFDALASEVLPEKKLKALISWDDETQTPQAGVYREMREFDAFLKLRIAEKRQEKLGVSDPLPEAEYDSDVEYAFPVAAAAVNPAERERLVDLIRWRKIDELGAQNQMDFTALCCYRMQLAMLEKFRKRRNDDGSVVFEQAVDKLALQIK